MSPVRLADLTLDELKNIIREEIKRASQEIPAEDLLQSDLSDFPVDHYGAWPADLSLRREEMYDDRV